MEIIALVKATESERRLNEGQDLVLPLRVK